MAATWTSSCETLMYQNMAKKQSPRRSDGIETIAMPILMVLGFMDENVSEAGIEPATPGL